jgi:hypothetical protein
MKQKALLMSLFSMFSDTNVGIKKPSCGWKHDDQRLAKADKKRLRKNAIRLRNKQRV